MKRGSCVFWMGLGLLLVTGPAAAPLRSGPHLERPKGWKLEETPYPPRWAKELEWKGALEIRFPPGWFDQDAPTFWSYPVLYWLEGDVLTSRTELEQALRAYDGGLYGGLFDRDEIKIALEPDKRTDKLGHTVLRRAITIEGFDPFTTKRPLTTHLETFRWYCPESKRTAVLLLRSPRAFKPDDPVWAELLPFWERFACHNGQKTRAKAEPVLPPLNEKVVTFAQENIGKKVGDGICITFAILALKEAGARPFPLDRADGDYEWGERIERFEDALPGDILQFRDAVFDGRRSLGKGRNAWWHEEYPHHTAIVAGVSDGGKILTILHQNYGGKGKSEADKKMVQEGMLRMSSLQKGGWVRVYRPVAKLKEGLATGDGSDN